MEMFWTVLDGTSSGTTGLSLDRQGSKTGAEGGGGCIFIEAIQAWLMSGLGQ